MSERTRPTKKKQKKFQREIECDEMKQNKEIVGCGIGCTETRDRFANETGKTTTTNKQSLPFPIFGWNIYEQNKTIQNRRTKKQHTHTHS